ncbi:hypothetical protein GCM10029976_055000 [Kribbella albertanoniae]|uniref:ATP-grasp domain-containing protein n=1 Tax=Kribbella albertanoniae TaxID=1266829 RepID=A0A4V2XRU0_9ACTN|nr:ATP-grasp domain-containing protein [Kribbella albertanoniae]TDC30675.1 ATP-grasp domain-containing protein [Kribbella albertanoniae]
MTLLVVVDHGAVTSGDLVVGVAFHEHVAFVLPADHQAAELVAVLEAAGPVVPLSGDEAADLARLRTFAPTGILTFSERALAGTARLADELGLVFHRPDVVTALTDKAEQRALLAKHGVDEVRSRTIGAASQWPGVVAELGLPLVVKPIRGEGSRDTHLVHSCEAGEEILADLLAGGTDAPTMVVEEYLVGVESAPFGDYISVEYLSQGARHDLIGLTGKLPQLPPFRETGQFVPATVAPELQAEIVDLVGRALDALGVRDGITHTEVKLTADGPRIIEVNGRLGGHLNELYRRASALDMVELAARVALGEAVVVAPTVAERVYFQFYCQPPLTATRLLAVEGARDVLRQAGISGRRQLVRPGSRLPADSRSFDLDLICGEVGQHSELSSIPSSALLPLRCSFATPAGDVWLNAAEMLTREGDH